MSERPPASPLFPYTTLFRSRGDALPRRMPQVLHVGGEVAREKILVRRRKDRYAARASSGRKSAIADCHGMAFRPVGERRDRKSTRLNSSHLGISYAVFCLKK